MKLCVHSAVTQIHFGHFNAHCYFSQITDEEVAGTCLKSF